MEISKDFEEFFGLLNKHKVRYLVVGGYAVAIHSKPRYTNDIDILVEPELDNAKRTLQALGDFGFGNLGIKQEDFLNREQVIQLGYPPLRIDLLTSVSGVNFAEAWSRKVDSKYGDQTVHFIGKQDLIASKKGAGRKRDLLDLDELT